MPLKIEDVEVDDLKKLITLIKKLETRFSDDGFLGWAQVYDMEKAGLIGKGMAEHFMNTTQALIIQTHTLNCKTLVER